MNFNLMPVLARITVLPRVKVVKDLGVLCDEKLSFNHHKGI